MKALVVGGAGATGTVIVETLRKRGYRVTILHRGVHEPDLPDDVEHIHADPHWSADLHAALEGRSFDLAIAVYGRLRFVAEALIGRTPRLISVGGALPVYKGWMRVTDPNPWDSMEHSPVPIDEDHPLSGEPGVDGFSLQVRDAEQVVMQAHADGHFLATHFRYPIVYGPLHIAPPEWGIIRRVRDGRRRLLVPGGGLALISRGFSRNIVHGLELALDQSETSAGQIYNICDERVLYNFEWVEALGDLMEHEFDQVDIPFSLLPKGFRAAPPLLLYRYHRVMDISKLKSELGYRDVVSVEQALEETVRWYSDHPLASGCEEERNLGDPFDYAYEDALVDRYYKHREALRDEIEKLDQVEVTWRHPYPHPKKRGDLR